MTQPADYSRRALPGGKTLAWNSALTLAGQIFPLLVALFIMPLLIAGLGKERFGILSLAWAVIGYFTLFDLGLSRATTKYFAEALARGGVQDLPSIFWTSLFLNLILGILAGALLTASTPFLVPRVFSLTGVLENEVRMTFYILAAAVPLILLSTVLRGVLEAGQRFGLINIAQMSAGPLLFILPLLGLSLGVGLVGIIAFLVVVRLLFAVLFLLMCLRAFPPVRGRARLDRNLIKPLFSFGGWLTISNVAGLILLYLDRFIIGSLISVSALAYYVVPWEMLIRLMVFPSSVTTVLFPAFSATKVISQDLIARLYSRSIKYLLVVMAPILFLMILFAADILRLWLGSDYAAKCSTVLQILAIGMTFTPFQVSLSLIQGMGRPDVIARFYVAELVLYLPLASFMATRYGIEGVAVAWTIRAGIDTVLLLWASVRMFNLRWRAMAENGLIRGVLAVALLGGAFGAMLHAEMSVATRILAASVCVAFFMIVSWRLVMDPRDREFLGFGTLR